MKAKTEIPQPNMMNYHESEKAFFDWLMAKHAVDSDFCFTLRHKANKGSETDYFIGTERSKYFGTTFWTMPAAFPGAAVDAIFFQVRVRKTGFHFRVEFSQTQNPHDNQNKLVLKFLKQLKPKVKEQFETFKQNSSDNKNLFYQIGNIRTVFKTTEELFKEIDLYISKLVPLIDDSMRDFAKANPTFVGHRVTNEEFAKMIVDLEDRQSKNGIVTNPPLSPNTKDYFVEKKLNQILFGPPGTGKTYNTIAKAISIVDPEYFQQYSSNREMLTKRFRELLIEDWKDNNGQIVFTTFHHSMSYEDFIEGIKPQKPDSESTYLKYEIHDGLFKRLCLKAQSKNKKISFDEAYDLFIQDIKKKKLVDLNTPKKGNPYTASVNGKNNIDVIPKTKSATKMVVTKEMIKNYVIYNIKKGWKPYAIPLGDSFKELFRINGVEVEMVDNGNKNFVLIIDEINRGNVSQIFGELITLIEEDKRLGKSEALEVMLPYSKEKFGVPANLYIIGTMNTADRSVEALDTALRRRFSFEEMKPEYDLKELDYTIAGQQAGDILRIINRRIEKLLDRDHAIGHSYFMLKDAENREENFRRVFYDNLIPLLQEYFFGDYSKIGLVLGKGFVAAVSDNDNKNIFADFDTEIAGDFEDRQVYEIIRYKDLSATETINSKPTNFEGAIELLMNSGEKQ